jgi:hypothetical protein
MNGFQYCDGAPAQFTQACFVSLALHNYVFSLALTVATAVLLQYAAVFRRVEMQKSSLSDRKKAINNFPHLI